MIRTGLRRGFGALLVCGAIAVAPTASAQYRGELVKFAYKSCPGGTLPAEGQELKITDYPDLFATIGKAYGGDGVTTFALPDMRGRTSMGAGSAEGRTTRAQGEKGGGDMLTLTENQMPRHEHTALIRTTSGAGNAYRALGAIFATTQANKYVAGGLPAANLMNRETVEFINSGDGKPFERRSPGLGIQYCILPNGASPG
jgi:microcystin-dependent protein